MLTCMSKNVVNCNSVTVELPIYVIPELYLLILLAYIVIKRA